MKLDRKAYLALLVSFLLTGLAIFDGTPVPVAVLTVTIPVMASYWLIVRFNGTGMILVPVLWALSVFVRSYLTGTLDMETLKIVGVKALGGVVLVLAYVAVTRDR